MKEMFVSKKFIRQAKIDRKNLLKLKKYFEEVNKELVCLGGGRYRYPKEWSISLRINIRNKYNYICQLCGNYGNTVHHIDYDKENCKPSNLINLCKRCNISVNANRDYWKNHFQILKNIR